jgi:uncharacterized protein Usg
MAKSELLQQLNGYSLTTADILYRLPDFPGLIQSFVWQDYDYAPEFPRLIGFLDYWRTHLDAPLYRITVTHKSLVSPAQMRHLDGHFVFH